MKRGMGHGQQRGEVAIRAREGTTDGRVSFRFASSLFHGETSMNQWRQWCGHWFPKWVNSCLITFLGGVSVQE